MLPQPSGARAVKLVNSFLFSKIRKIQAWEETNIKSNGHQNNT